MMRFRNLFSRWVHAAILLLMVVLLVVLIQGASAEECTSACTPGKLRDSAGQFDAKRF